MDEKACIGVFDSGYGGLSILKEIVRVLPEYHYVYLGDNARAPYGTRSFETVYHYTLEAVKKLFEMNCRLVILACNTASAKALRTIQQIDLPHLAPEKRVLGVIRPSAEVLVHYSRNGHIGILATRGTVLSGSYPMELEKLHGCGQFKITQLACPMWVPLVESNELQGEGAEFFVRKYIDELFSVDPLIDTLMLGCTHYPLLQPLIEKYLPDEVTVVAQGSIVAHSLQDYLYRHHEDMEIYLSHENKIEYYTTDNAEMFEKMAEIFMGHTVTCNAIQIC